MNRPTRFYSNQQEKAVARATGGKKVANSGATAFHKGDVEAGDWLIECKTCIEEKKSFSIKRRWLETNKEEAFAMNKIYSALAFNFGPGTDNYYIIDESTFNQVKQLNEVIDELERETRWIPVRERLPDKFGQYICTLLDKDGKFIELLEWNETFGGSWQTVLEGEDSYSDIGNVIAWMPLPQSYKADKE